MKKPGQGQGSETKKPDSMAGLCVLCRAVTAVHPAMKTELFRAEKHFLKFLPPRIMRHERRTQYPPVPCALSGASLK